MVDAPKARAPFFGCPSGPREARRYLKIKKTWLRKARPCPGAQEDCFRMHVHVFNDYGIRGFLEFRFGAQGFVHSQDVSPEMHLGQPRAHLIRVTTAYGAASS